jgi:hypothetical protein
MQKFYKTIGIAAIIVITVFTMIACGKGSSKVINSSDALKEYLDSQPANSTDKPIEVTMNVNDLMLEDIVNVINSAGKYVILDFSKSTALTNIADRGFQDCRALTGIVLPDNITKIGREAFRGCANLNSFTIGNSISSIGRNVFQNCNNLKNFTVIGVDKSLNGTWISDEKEIFIFINGTLKQTEDANMGDILLYTTKDGNITVFDFYTESGDTDSYSINGNTITIANNFTLIRQ